MSKTETKKYDYVEELKSNYRRRIQDTDDFSKSFSNNSSNYRSEVLAAWQELFQYYIDLQRKFMSTYPKWYSDKLMTKNSQIITEFWTQTIRNMDSFYSEFLGYASKNMRTATRIGMQALQMSERYYDMFEDIPQRQRDTLIELIKEAKQYNDKYVKDNLQKEANSSQKNKSKKETLLRDAG